MLNTLADRGCIIREIDKSDSRNRIIKANPLSSSQLNEIFVVLAEVNTTIQADLTKTLLDQLYKLLETIHINLEKFVEG